MGTLNQQLIAGLPLGSGDSIHALAGTGAVITYELFGCEVSSSGLINKVLAQGQLAATDGLVYSPPAGGAAAIVLMAFVNTSSSPVTGVAVAINGSAATAANQLIPSLTIPANGSATFKDGELRVYDSGGNLYQTSTSTSFDSTLPAPTVPLTLTGVVGTAATAPHRDHQHQSPGGIASIIAASAAIVDTQVQVVGATIPAGLLKAGTVLILRASGTITSTVDNIITFRARLGPTTLTGNIPASLAAHPGNSGTTTAAPFALEIRVTIRTVGASGTCYGGGFVASVASGAAVSQALANSSDIFAGASVAVDTTGANVFELTCVTAANTTAVTFQTAHASVEKM